MQVGLEFFPGLPGGRGGKHFYTEGGQTFFYAGDFDNVGVHGEED